MNTTGIHGIRTLGLGTGNLGAPLPLPPGTSSGWTEADWRLADGACQGFCAGTWEGEPGEIPVAYTYDEFCFMLSGRVALVDETGGRVEFGVGDAFHVPRGFTGRWVTVTTARKHYVIVE